MNKYLKKHQQDYIGGVILATDTMGMDAGAAHKITVLELSIRLHVDSMLNRFKGIPRLTEKHNEAGFRGLVKQVECRDNLLKGM